MPDFTITVSDNDAKIITKVANEGSRTPREFMEYHISLFAKGQIEGYFIDKIRNKTTEELITLLGDIE